MADYKLRTLAKGRRVAVHQLAGGGDPVIFCHPAPGAGNFDPDPVETAAQGVTLLALDRPGYGGSDPVRNAEWATPARAAADIAEVLDGLGIRSVGVAGWSAGGRVALALAAGRPDLVSRAVVFATPAPDEEVPWIPPEYKAGIQALRGLPPTTVHARLSGILAATKPADFHAPEALAALGSSPGDTAILARADTRQRLGDMLAKAWKQGAAGIAADIAGYTLQPWGFDPGDVKARVLLVYGEADPVVGEAHGRWWQEKLPDTELELAADMGHLLAIPLWGRALAFLTRG